MRFLIQIAAAFALVPQIALACACCSDPGQREISQSSISDYDRSMFGALKPEPRVQVFMNACGAECVKGITDPADEYPAKVAFSPTGFSIDLTDSTGSITARYPEFLDWFATDVGSFMPAHLPMYSEIRLKVVLHADGVFSDADGQIADLVLAGTSNSCMWVGDYRRWSLQVSRGWVDFRLFGDIASQK